MSKPLAPGLYERLIDLALERELRGLDSRQWSARTEPPDSTDRPRLLARYVAELLRLSLRAHTGKDAEERQLKLVRRLLEQLIKVDGGVVDDDRLKEPAELLSALIQTQGLAEPRRPQGPESH